MTERIKITPPEDRYWEAVESGGRGLEGSDIFPEPERQTDENTIGNSTEEQ